MRHFILLLLSTSLFASSFIPKEFEAKLDQVVKRRVANKISKEPLKLKYKYPKNIAMYLDNMTYICNAQTTWRYTPEFIEGQKGEVNIGKSSKYCFSSIFDALKYGFKKNDIYVVKKDIKNSIVVFEFKDKAQKSLSISSIEFKFDKKISNALTLKDVKTMKIKYPQKSKKDTLYEIKKISTSVNYTDADFIFNIPKNTKKVYLN